MEMKMPHGGTQGIGMGLVKRCVSWFQCFTGWTSSQVDLLVAAGIIIAAKVLL